MTMTMTMTMTKKRKNQTRQQKIQEECDEERHCLRSRSNPRRRRRRRKQHQQQQYSTVRIHQQLLQILLLLVLIMAIVLVPGVDFPLQIVVVHGLEINQGGQTQTQTQTYVEEEEREQEVDDHWKQQQQQQEREEVKTAGESDVGAGATGRDIDTDNTPSIQDELTTSTTTTTTNENINTSTSTSTSTHRIHPHENDDLTSNEDKRTVWGGAATSGTSGTSGTSSSQNINDDNTNHQNHYDNSRIKHQDSWQGEGKERDKNDNDDNAPPSTQKDIPFVLKSSSSAASSSSSSSSTTTAKDTHTHTRTPAGPKRIGDSIHYQPPHGFYVTARVYTDPHDKQAYFDIPYYHHDNHHNGNGDGDNANDGIDDAHLEKEEGMEQDKDTSNRSSSSSSSSSSQLVLPYWECGMDGSTTVPIPLQHATIRHLLQGSKPTYFRGTGIYPQLIVALAPLHIELNSGTSHIFQTGDVILCEDTITGGGHKLQGADGHDLKVLLLTLTEPYHQTGKDKSSLASIFQKTNENKNKAGGFWDSRKHQQGQSIPPPCPDDLEKESLRKGGFVVDGTMTSTGQPPDSSRRLGILDFFRPQQQSISRFVSNLQPRSVRRYILTVLGLSISTIVGDFVGKVAPLWVTVVFGGGCFVAGGTYAFVQVTDKAVEEFEIWQERRQWLQIQGNSQDETSSQSQQQQQQQQQHYPHDTESLHYPSTTTSIKNPNPQRKEWPKERDEENENLVS